MSEVFVHSVSLMDTVVSIQVVGHGASVQEQGERAAAVERAVDWFREVERTCSRFDATSEVRALATRPGEPVEVSAMLYEVVRFALALAEESGGAFDPTVGVEMERRGFDREYRTGLPAASGVTHTDRVTYRDVQMDDDDRTVTLRRALVLDLGAVAKGFAIDLAARELHAFGNFAIDAGGDLFFAGTNGEGEPWSVGIRHPRDAHRLLRTLHVSNASVCTSGDYERPANAGGHHIIDPRSGASPTAVASVTVVADTAMVADGLATAAFVLGPAAGLALLDHHGVEGLIVTTALEEFETARMQQHAESRRSVARPA